MNVCKVKRSVADCALIPAPISITVANAAKAAQERNSVSAVAVGCAPGNILCNGTCIDDNIDDNIVVNVECLSFRQGCRSGSCIPYAETNNNNGYA